MISDGGGGGGKQGSSIRVWNDGYDGTTQDCDESRTIGQ